MMTPPLEEAPPSTPAQPRPSLWKSDSLLAALLDATADLAEVAPGLLPCRILAYRDSLQSGLVGAYATLLGEGEALHVGVQSDGPSCVELARTLVGRTAFMQLDATAVRSAVCDVTAVLARGVNRRLSGSWHLGVGTPVFVDGVARRTRDTGMRAAEVVLGPVRVTLVLLAPDPLNHRDRARRGEEAT